VPADGGGIGKHVRVVRGRALRPLGMGLAVPWRVHTKGTGTKGAMASKGWGITTALRQPLALAASLLVPTVPQGSGVVLTVQGAAGLSS